MSLLVVGYCGWLVGLRAAGVVSNVVQHVLVPVVDSVLCNRLYEKIADKVKLDISDDMMCAGIEQGGRDACQVPDHHHNDLTLCGIKTRQNK